MQLKKIDIKGFKSFGKATTIHFSEHVTGVVGPNGSGKSNVVDAIRWVLGEQRSKDLRLEKMSDVLFNGTKTRKRAGMAQVTITFENDDGLLPLEYNEVSISRVLYRSGQSEYRLNDVACRLKDITNLLANTGIGSNSYAIIELAMVDDILQDKNNARRRMFEQAAGIYGFKRRKHETTLKLKATNADLERVQDLLHEIESNMKQLEKQARRAKKYLKLKENYRESSIQLASHNLSAFKSKYEELKSDIQKAQADQTEVYALINKTTAAIEKKKLGIENQEVELNQMQKAVRTAEHQLNALQNEISLLRNTIQHNEQDGNKEEEQIKSYQDRITNFSARIEEIEKESLEREKELNQKKDELEKARTEKTTLAEKMSDLESVKKELIDQQNELNEQVAVLERTLAVEANKLESTNNLIKHTQEEIQANAGKLKETRTEAAEKDKERDKVQEEVSKLSALYEQETQNSNKLKEILENHTKSINDLNRQVDARQNEYDLLKNMIENLEGFPDSIKFLAKQNRWKNKASLLSEIIVCKEDYRKAIEAYLEPHLNYYVVKGRQEASDAITLLKDAQKGRASFYDALTFETKTDVKFLDFPGFTAALDVVEISEEYRGLIQNLLKDVYIHDGKSPFDAGTKIPDGITIVAHDGHRIQSQKRMSGGSPGLFDGIKIGRKKNLEKLEKEINKIQSKIDAEKIERRKTQKEFDEINLTIIQQDLDAMRSKFATVDTELNVLKKRVTELTEKLSKEQNRVEELEQLCGQIKTKIKESENNLAESKIKREKVSKELSGESSVIDRLNNDLSILNQVFSEKNIAYVQAEGQINQLRQEQQLMKNNQLELEELIQKSQNNRQRLQTSHSENIARLEELENKLREAYEAKDQTGENLSGTEQQYFSAKNDLHESEKELSIHNKKNSDLQFLLTSLKDKYNEIKIKLNDISQRVKVEFNISTLELMKLELPEDLNGEQLSEDVEKMRVKLYGFGEVNPLAVEAFNEMKERHETITGQKTDIEDAQKSLLDTIKELEDQATLQFMESFDEIKVHFQKIFRSLFSAEDTCDLILLDPENPLESGIEVLAKPKGKRPQSLSQLSGGEKTLTATALLFALYLLKPAPFCIFDEVDAPLDDANIQKFNQIIKHFSGDSQFVIITHNKLTMAAVDVIYGVYMEEPGISSVAPVDFRALKHEMLPLELSEN